MGASILGKHCALDMILIAVNRAEDGVVKQHNGIVVEHNVLDSHQVHSFTQMLQLHAFITKKKVNCASL